MKKEIQQSNYQINLYKTFYIIHITLIQALLLQF